MATGKTPTMVLVGASQTVTLEDITTAMPFPSIAVRREYQERKTRDSASGAGKTIRVFRSYSNAEESIRVQVPYMAEADYTKMRTIIEADPPTVAVTYLHLTSENFDLVDLDPIPDSFWWDVEHTFQTSFTLLRQSG